MHKLKTFESFDSPYREIPVGQASDAFQSRGGWDKLTPSEAEQISDLIKKLTAKNLSINEVLLYLIYIHELENV